MTASNLDRLRIRLGCEPCESRLSLKVERGRGRGTWGHMDVGTSELGDAQRFEDVRNK